MGKGFAQEHFEEVVYFEHGGKGSKDGRSADNARALVDASIMSIPAGLIIEKVAVIVDTAVTGTTDLDIGDDDDADGFVDGSLSVTLGTPGMYGWDAKLSGAYLRVQTAGATDAGDIYVVPNAKYYSLATKSLKIDVTGSSSAGKLRVLVKGHKLAL